MFHSQRAYQTAEPRRELLAVRIASEHLAALRLTNPEALSRTPVLLALRSLTVGEVAVPLSAIRTVWLRDGRLGVLLDDQRIMVDARRTTRPDLEWLVAAALPNPTVAVSPA